MKRRERSLFGAQFGEKFAEVCAWVNLSVIGRMISRHNRFWIPGRGQNGLFRIDHPTFGYAVRQQVYVFEHQFVMLRKIPQLWWREARFGMFMHWGVYSIPGRGEWIQWAKQIPTDQYAQLADQFHPEHFDADAWASIAKAGGMKYMVLTARHHDGFALFDDPGSSFTAMKSAAHHDFVADYVKAVRKAGLGVGLYYSPLDWRLPGFFFPGIYQPSAIELREQYQRQIDELASHYGKLDILWFDGGGDEWLGFGGVEFTGSGWQARPKGKPCSGSFDWEDRKTVAHLRQLQPGIIVNDRTNAPADFRSREGDAALGDFDNQHPWELCTTITEGAWGYQANAKVKPLAHLLELLVGAAGRDGNMLLNVGPRPDGKIDPAQEARLREIGQWLSPYGEGICGTRGWSLASWNLWRLNT